MDDNIGGEKKGNSLNLKQRLISVAKQFLSCSGAFTAPLAPALIAQRENTKQFYYIQSLNYRYVYYGPTIAQCLGTLLSAFALRLLSRKHSLVLANLLHLLPLMMFLSELDLEYDFAALLLFHAAYRFQAPIITLYIAEVSEPMLRALFVGIAHVLDQLGFYINEVQPANSTALSALSLFSAVGCVVASVQAAESPYWLALQGKREKAEKEYEWLRGAGSATSDEALSLFEQVAADTEQLANGLLRNVFSLRFAVPLLVTVFMYFSDPDLVVLHQDTYFKRQYEIHYYDESSDQPFLFGLNMYYTLKYGLPVVSALLFCVLCLVIGRRILFIGSITLNLSLFVSYLYTPLPIYVVPFSVFITFIGAQQIPTLLATEIYPGITRDLGTAVSEFVQVIFYTIDYLVIFVGHYVQSYRTFLNFRWTLIPVGLICTYFYMPETRNATLVETDKLGSEITIP